MGRIDRSKTEMSTCQKALLWSVILALSLAFFITGMILILRSIEKENELNQNGGDPTVVVGNGATTTTTPEDVSGSPLGQFRHAAVTSPVGPCNTIGSDILAKYQGSAVDAAIATLLCNGVVNFYGSGIGGGQFFTIYDRPNDGTEKVFNAILGRERAPAAATEDMYVDGTVSSVRGGKAIGIPGDIKGLYHAWTKFGRVPWKSLIEPSIELCNHGTPVSGPLENWVKRYEEQIRETPGLRDLMIKSDGTAIAKGDLVKHPLLANTLSTIADDPTAFYDPSKQLAQDIVAEIQGADGIITLDDLENYEVYDKDPLSVHLSHGNYTIYGPPPPSGAVVVQYILNLLDGYSLDSEDIADTDSKILTYHRIAEAYKYAYAKRTQLADEDYVEIAELLRNLTSDAFAEETMQKIDDSQTFEVEHYEPVYSTEEDAGTVHISVLAGDGSAVAATSTINYAFGSFVVGNRTGIIYNNEMDDFSTPGLVNTYGYRPSPANYIRPGKMPLSSMSPIIITDGRGDVVYISGSSGGSKIISATTYVAIQSLWFGQRLDHATDTSRLHHQLVPNQLYTTGDDFGQEVLDGLVAKGHTMGTTSHNPVETILVKCHGTFEEMYDKTLCVSAVAGYSDAVDTDGY